jgi:hypothetical protein
MKKIVLISLMFMMFMGVVNASSKNGDYKGNPIVKLYNEGYEIKSDDVPALIYNGRTVVPISLLKKIGAEVTWDQSDYSVNITMPSTEPIPTPKPKIGLSELSKNMRVNGINLISYIVDGYSINSITYFSTYNYNDFISHNSEFDSILTSGLQTDADLLEIYYSDKYVFSVPISAISDFKSNKINNDQLGSFYKVQLPDGSYMENAASSSSPSPNPISLPIATPAPVTSVIKDYMLLYSNDGKTYLGKLTSDQYDADSIFNEYGTYGGKYSAKSIYNDYGTYGGKYSAESPFNKYSSTPPMILLNGKVVGYLTINEYVTDAISPLGLKEYLINLGY